MDLQIRYIMYKPLETPQVYQKKLELGSWILKRTCTCYRSKRSGFDFKSWASWNLKMNWIAKWCLCGINERYGYEEVEKPWWALDIYIYIYTYNYIFALLETLFLTGARMWCQNGSLSGGIHLEKLGYVYMEFICWKFSEVVKISTC